jgi:phage repressor protein C with HTH and peptisase S24 domain
MTNTIVTLKYSSGSMFPTIQDKDLVFIDLTDKNILDNKIYLVNENGVLKIRRVKQENPLISNFKITSDNGHDMDYKEYNVPEDKLREIIYGRAIFYMRNVF